LKRRHDLIACPPSQVVRLPGDDVPCDRDAVDGDDARLRILDPRVVSHVGHLVEIGLGEVEIWAGDDRSGPPPLFEVVPTFLVHLHRELTRHPPGEHPVGLVGPREAEQHPPLVSDDVRVPAEGPAMVDEPNEHVAVPPRVVGIEVDCEVSISPADLEHT
jgi:hypothetical protein